MNKKIFVLFVVLAFSFGSYGVVKNPAEVLKKIRAQNAFILDQFESGKLISLFPWQTMDIQPQIISTTKLQSGRADIIKEIGNYSLFISSTKTNNWYAGKMETQTWDPLIDYGPYNAFQIDIFGYGPKSGILKVYLIDDDSNGKLQRDSKGALLHDDSFMYSIPVTWRGWERMTIPLKSFKLDNPGKGDGVLTIAKQNGKRGLVLMGFLFISSSKEGVNSPQYCIDNIKLIKI